MANSHEQDSHLIITVHGIRTFGGWQERLEELVRGSDRAIEFRNYKYGYFSVLAFLFPLLRLFVVWRFRGALRRESARKRWKRIDIVGHSFGTFIIGKALRGLRPEEKIFIDTIILSGSVLKPSFDWNQLIGPRVKRVVNDCGSRDNILLLSQFGVLFTGMAGRIGFSGMTSDQLRNRYSQFGHGGYFESAAGGSNDDYMKQKWVSLLTRSDPIPVFDDRPPLSAVSGFTVWLGNNIEPVKLAIYLTPLVLALLYVLSLYRTAEAERANAVFQRDQALQQRNLALLAESVALENSAKRFLETADRDSALYALTKALPLSMAKPNRPFKQSLISVLDAALSLPAPYKLFPISSSLADVSTTLPLVAVAQNNKIEIRSTETGLETAAFTHETNVERLFFSPDGKLLLSATAEEAKIWDISDNRLLRSLKIAKNSGLRDLRFVPKSKKVVIAYHDGRVQLWNFELDSSVEWQAHNVERFNSKLDLTAISADGRYYATAAADRMVRVWSTSNGEQFSSFRMLPFLSSGLALNADGSLVSIAGDVGVIQVWSTTQKIQSLVPRPSSSFVSKLVFSPDGKYLIGSDGDVHIWEVDNNFSKVKTLPSQTGSIDLIKFSKDGTRFLTATKSDPAVLVWNANSFDLQATAKFDSASPLNADFVGNDSLFVVSAGRAVALWNFREENGHSIVADTDLGGEPGSYFFTLAKNAEFVAGYNGNAARIWSRNAPAQGYRLLKHAAAINDLRFHTRSGRVVTASSDGTAIIWDALTGAQLNVLKGHTGVLETAYFIRDGKLVLTGARDKTIRIWDAASGQLWATLSGKGTYSKAVTDRHGTVVVSMSQSDDLMVWYLNEEKFGRSIDFSPDKTIVTDEYSGSFDLSHNGKFVVVGFRSGKVSLFDIANGKEIATQRVHSGPVTSIEFSANDEKVISTGEDGQVIVWDAADLNRVAAVRPWKERSSVEISDTGRLVYIFGYNNQMRIWLPESNTMLRQLDLSNIAPRLATIDWERSIAVVIGMRGRLVEWNFASSLSKLQNVVGSQGSPEELLIAYARAISINSTPRSSVDLAFDLNSTEPCDLLAANPFDPNRKSPGHLLSKLDEKRAEDACRTAVSNWPNQGRFHYQLGRALSKQKKNAQAKEALLTAKRLKYAFADVGLYYLENEIAPKSPDVIKFLKAADQSKIVFAIHELGQILIKGEKAEKDEKAGLNKIVEAERLGSPHASCYLSTLYERGELVTQSFEKAFEFAIKCVQRFEELGIPADKEAFQRAVLARLLDPKKLLQIILSKYETK